MSSAPDLPAPWLREALRELGVEASALVPVVGPTPWSTRPRSYLVSSSDGRRMKIRSARREDVAARAAVLTYWLGDSRLPAPLARVGRFTAEAWVEGASLSSVRLQRGHVDLAADLLAAVHRFAGMASEHLPRHQRPTPVLRRAERHLSELVAAARIARSDAAELGRLLALGLPASSRWGLTHGDFCGENLVVRPDGTVASIDNELVGRGFLEYDLARMWYRWQMPRWADERFDAYYRSATGVIARPADEQRAWRVAAVLKGFHLRHRRNAPTERARDSLRALLDT